jgi:hypothetical protein
MIPRSRISKLGPFISDVPIALRLQSRDSRLTDQKAVKNRHRSAVNPQAGSRAAGSFPGFEDRVL